MYRILTVEYCVFFLICADILTKYWQLMENLQGISLKKRTFWVTLFCDVPLIFGWE